MEKQKEKLLNKLKAHINFVREKVREKLAEAKKITEQSLKGLGRMTPEDQALFMNLRGNAFKRFFELTHLESSPYFMKCEVIDEDGNDKDYFFAKHQFSEESIYSWVAPVSAIRFENPGKTSYKVPNGKIKTVTIKQKETYMIVDGKVLLFSLETEGKPRELIYQEHFTKQKSEFVLPEIVAQMEKAQDQVIRADYKGPLVISGPAGSGKTTLALHRVAYLIQVPDMTDLYKPDSIMVLVQDNGTKNYFSTLLPSLGINDVKITTFSEWAFKVLNLEGYSYEESFGRNEEEKDFYEYQKLQALRGGPASAWNKNIFTVLNSQYFKYLSGDNLKLFAKQKKEKKLDRFDLVILLKSHFEKHKKFEIKRAYQTFVKHELVRKIEKTSVLYSLMIIDEFQNYLPEQLEIFKSCLDEKTQSVVYVGDMAQQVKLGTIRNWEEAGEIISPERNIKLNKVYRNTKNILSFIKSLGYDVELPVGLKEGPTVLEKITNSTEEEIKHIKENIEKYKEGSVGILAKDESYLSDFKKEFADIKNIHVLTMLEAQGVEFDLVFIVGTKNESSRRGASVVLSTEYLEERKRMQKDLLYVALTRAITKLHILGSEKLSYTL
jgi:DNA helicase-2/ATP-dependent DNA helicase PcrA